METVVPTSGSLNEVVPKSIEEEDMKELRRGPWTLEEDTLLTHYISNHGEGRWNLLAKCAGLKRTGKSCRLRWLNYLKPDIKRGNLTPQEQVLILELHSKWGNRWSKIAQHLPGRTDNEIKNYWRTRVQKQARQLNIESNSKMFLDTVRCFWMPRLIEKMEQTNSSSILMDTQNFNFQSDYHHELSNSMMPNYSNASSSSSQPVFTNLIDDDIVIHSNQNYDMNYSIDPSFLSSELIAFPSNQLEIPQNLSPTSPYPYNPLFFNEGHCMESDNGYSVEGTYPMQTVGNNYEILSTSMECQMADSEWGSCDDMASALWNIDDTWQVRK